jgi:hypothetical protein
MYWRWIQSFWSCTGISISFQERLIGVYANLLYGFERFIMQNLENVTLDALVTFTAAKLFKGPTEVGQGPQFQQIDADERLDPRYCPDPAGGAQRILMGLHAGNPGSNVELTPAQGKSGEKTEV